MPQIINVLISSTPFLSLLLSCSPSTSCVAKPFPFSFLVWKRVTTTLMAAYTVTAYYFNLVPFCVHSSLETFFIGILSLSHNYNATKLKGTSNTDSRSKVIVFSLSHAAPRSYVESVARSAAAGGEQSTSSRSLSPLGETTAQQRIPSPTSHTLNPPLSSSSPIQSSQG